MQVSPLSPPPQALKALCFTLIANSPLQLSLRKQSSYYWQSYLKNASMWLLFIGQHWLPNLCQLSLKHRAVSSSCEHLEQLCLGPAFSLVVPGSCTPSVQHSEAEAAEEHASVSPRSWWGLCLRCLLSGWG